MPANLDGAASGLREAVPELSFGVNGAHAVAHAAAPTIGFELAVEVSGAHPVRSVLLDVQIQIAARQRPYGEGCQERLSELFGTPDRWSTTLRTLPWCRTTLVVPPFTEATVVELPVSASYDLEVSASRYFAALEEGQIPLEFLFSGTVFYSGRGGALQAARIAWDREADYRMPLTVWREAIDRHFPGSAWLRLRRESFDRLLAYKATHSLESFDIAIDKLLGEPGTAR